MGGLLVIGGGGQTVCWLSDPSKIIGGLPPLPTPLPTPMDNADSMIQRCVYCLQWGEAGGGGGEAGNRKTLLVIMIK